MPARYLVIWDMNMALLIYLRETVSVDLANEELKKDQYISILIDCNSCSIDSFWVL